ncbi:TIGR04222 domain-containing membrane protein [Pinirhizobacter sp.]|uniref:TIGR04222 domain-containing membrane protein n=1 Tax=Pinirhizobacter sp. TaxID=2950432 RepID=UPI002F3FDB33
MGAVTIACGVGFVVALYMTLVWRMLMARWIWRAAATMKIARVSAYQMALMNGGVPRVALTGVVRLLGRGAFEAGVSGVLTLNDTCHDELDHVEREAVAETRNPAVFREFLIRLEARLKRNGVARQLRGELIAMDYMRAWGSKAWWTNYASNMLPFAILTVVAWAAMASVSMTPDAYHALMAFSGFCVLIMLVVALPRQVTALGRYIVWSATQHHPDLKDARASQGDALDNKTLGQSVALYGADALAGSDLAWIPGVLSQVSSSD